MCGVVEGEGEHPRLWLGDGDPKGEVKIKYCESPNEILRLFCA